MEFVSNKSMLRVVVFLMLGMISYSSSFVPRDLPIAGDLLTAIGSSALPDCGHIEYKTDIATRSVHIIQVYGCDGVLTDTFNITLENVNIHWNELNSRAQNFVFRPKIVGRYNGFAIVYMDNSSTTDIVLRTYNLNGVQLSSTVEFVGGFHPDIGMLTDGRFAITWHRVVTYVPFISVFNSDGSKSIDKRQIRTFGNRPKIAGLKDGGWVVAVETKLDGNIGLIIQLINSPVRELNATPAWTPSEKAAIHNDGFPRIHSLSSSVGFIVSWHNNGRLFARIFDGVGTPQGDTIELSHPDNINNNLTIRQSPTDCGLGKNGLDGYVLAWREESPTFSASMAIEFTGNGSHSIRLLRQDRSSLTPVCLQTSAGYGLDFFAFETKAHYPDLLMYATCNMSSVSCPTGVFQPNNICFVYPCSAESCCKVHNYGISINEKPLQTVAANIAERSVTVDGFYLKYIDSAYLEMDIFVPTFPMKKGTRIILKCGSNRISCTFIISVYNCPPCSDHIDGGIPIMLPQLGWIEVGSPPSFQLPGSVGTYAMRSFKMEIPGPSVVERWTEISLENEGRYIAIFGKQGDVTGISQPTHLSGGSDCSFPAVVPEMFHFLSDFSNLSKLGI